MTMLDFVEEATEPVVKPKRRSGYDRQKRKVKYVTEMFTKERDELTKDIAALEGLVGTLLNHLDRAISPDMTEDDRERYRMIVRNTRAALEE